MNKLERIFFSLGTRNFLNWMPDYLFLKIKYRIRMKRTLNLKEPTTFNEKLQWLKLYDRKSEYTTMVDKYAVRKHIKEKIGEEYLIPLIGGPWESFDEIDYDSLPNQFVLKCTHDSGGLVICRDKTEFDKKAAKNKITRCMKRNYYYSSREWPYKNVLPRIVAEKYMVDDSDHEQKEKKGLTDYKFYCFDGEPKFLYVSQGLENHAAASIDFLTLDWRFAPFGRSDYKSFDVLPKKPINYDKMLSLCEVLSEGHAFLRVDLYEIKGKIYFSELTFYPVSGMMPFSDEADDERIGKMLTLPKVPLTGN